MTDNYDHAVAAAFDGLTAVSRLLHQAVYENQDFTIEVKANAVGEEPNRKLDGSYDIHIRIEPKVPLTVEVAHQSEAPAGS